MRRWRTGRDSGGESNRLRCSVCSYQIDTKVQQIGGGAGDKTEAFTDVDSNTLHLSVVTKSSACPFCGTDNWLIGSRGTRRL